MALVGVRASYHRILNQIEFLLPGKLRPIYNHPAGPKTVFFWAPVCKWGLVFAGLADMTRPADKLSLSQSGVLMTTGVIWSRWSLVIIPKNWFLFCCNCFLGASGATQLFRIWMYQQEVKKQQEAEAAELKIKQLAEAHPLLDYLELATLTN
ncbi:mitochondrial pyruvate carrier 2-like [Oncorhynchus tshawytscha]|uniref:Mitochondrial pyruvate carrier n=3 Tax=Oncorhynchus TaxID=8016 RepID=A0A8C7L921_ONCKI|nr:mitochondrial pyruvate carrier 2 [Oncorhynchus kisutch]XP_031676574.1 mitochondrial pyruvate carrier 2-like [Oncorhynchus kisutch]XP_036807278.1 mitochondrial pyruvate carrier 2-like [Oncorhynchus mykiss]XP_036838180.1 mitochondrial pyruvate carrier 2-like [Oncorhynchus mykiss]XP_042175343.1 mitochondrial pyruvate carrier 2-like [Oncorhynchus tshawytscha]